VSLKKPVLKRKITIKNIPKEKRDAFKRFLYSFEGAKDIISNWLPYPHLNLVHVICKDEESAAHLFELLTTTQFEDQIVECYLSDENLYSQGLENLKRRSQNYSNPMNAMNPMMLMNTMYNYNAYNPYMPFPMNNFFNGPANNNYPQNYYRNMNPYYGMQNPGFTKPAYNNNQSYNKKPYNQNYRNNDKKAYAKRVKQPRERNSKYGGKSNAHSNVEVNDREFPPL